MELTTLELQCEAHQSTDYKFKAEGDSQSRSSPLFFKHALKNCPKWV